MNGQSSLRFSHNIVKLYAAVQPLAPELLISQFVRPENMPASMWREESVVDFIRRLYQDGNADNRYLLYGYGRSPEDLFKLDQVVFSVRRLAQALEVQYVGEDEDYGLPRGSRRQALAERPTKHANLQSNLEQTMEGKRGQELQRVLLNWNFPFTDHQYRHEQSTFTFASQNPILMIRLYEPLDCGESNNIVPVVTVTLENGNIVRGVTLPNMVSKKIIAPLRRLSGFKQPRQCGDDMFRMLVTGPVMISLTGKTGPACVDNILHCAI